MVEQLFLAVPRGCLQFVIVVFPDHTHLLFFLVICGARLVYHIILFLLPSSVRSPDITEILFTGILTLNLINQFK